jgi:hypothetical protein
MRYGVYMVLRIPAERSGTISLGEPFQEPIRWNETNTELLRAGQITEMWNSGIHTVFLLLQIGLNGQVEFV